MQDDELEQIINALKDKALGNTVTQVTEQYKMDKNGKDVLTDRIIKKTKNDIDTQACIKLIDLENKRRESERDALQNMSPEELEAEKNRLLRELGLAFSNKER